MRFGFTSASPHAFDRAADDAPDRTKTNKLATSTYNGTKTVAFQELASDQPSDPIYVSRIPRRFRDVANHLKQTYNNLIEKGVCQRSFSATLLITSHVI